MKKLFTIFLFLAMFFLAPLVEANGWLSGYYNRIKIPIDATKVDAALSDFPVPIKLTSSNFDFSKANSDGFDFRFTAADGTTLLKYERERHDSANSLAEYWVKVPSISDSADTYIYLYYRTTDTADGADSENVWNSNFKAVHHLKDNTTSAVLDSTSNNNDGTKKGANEPVEATGQIYKAQDFDGTDDYIYLTNCQNATEGTFEGWIKYDTLATYSRLMMDVSGYFTLGTSGSYNNRMKFAIYDSDGNLKEALDDDTFTTGNWIYAVGTYKGSEKVKLYVNGALKKESADAAASGGLQDVSEQIRIGRAADVRYFDGIIDEVRISNVARSDAWIKASYHAGAGSLLKSFTNETLYGNFFLMFF